MVLVLSHGSSILEVGFHAHWHLGSALKVSWQLTMLPDHLLCFCPHRDMNRQPCFPPVPKKLSFILVNGTFGQLSFELEKCGFCLYFSCHTVSPNSNNVSRANANTGSSSGLYDKHRDVSVLTTVQCLL